MNIVINQHVVDLHNNTEHRDKKLYGILAAVHISESLRQRVLGQGLYLARIHNDLFELQVPEDFQPRRFNHRAQ